MTFNMPINVYYMTINDDITSSFHYLHNDMINDI